MFHSTLSVGSATSFIYLFSTPLLISIHALSEESDLVLPSTAVSAMISIHALREESDISVIIKLKNRIIKISIHALREESDLLIT